MHVDIFQSVVLKEFKGFGKLDTSVSIFSETQTHLSGQSFLGDHFECIDYRDVAEPPGNRQSTVPILDKKINR